MTIDPIDLAEGRRLLDAATPGPWTFVDASDHRGRKGEFRAPGPYNGLMLVGPWCNDTDLELIVWARNNLPALIAALDQADSALAERNTRIVNLEQGREIERHALRNAIDTLTRVREIAERADSARWRQTPLLSVDQAEGMNIVGEDILRALDGDQ